MCLFRASLGFFWGCQLPVPCFFVSRNYHNVQHCPGSTMMTGTQDEVGPVQEHVFGRLVSENPFSLGSVTAGSCNFSEVFLAGSHLELFSLLSLYPSTLGLWFQIAHIPSASLSRSQQHCSCGFFGHRLPGTAHLGSCDLENSILPHFSWVFLHFFRCTSWLLLG